VADISDVEMALIAVLAGALYPAGTGAPSTIGAIVRLYRGWPVPGALENDLRQGIMHITVLSIPGGRGAIAPIMGWHTLSQPESSLTTAVSGQTLTLGGVAGAGQVIAVTVNGIVQAYAVQAQDNLTTLASALATMISAITPATSEGAVITVPAAATLSAMTGAQGALYRELARQSRSISVNIWSPTAALRDAAGAAVHLAVCDALRLYLPDQSVAMIGADTDGWADDSAIKQGLYRRTIKYGVEYPIIQRMIADPYLSVGLSIVR